MVPAERMRSPMRGANSLAAAIVGVPLVIPKASASSAACSTFVRPAHRLQRCLYMPPSIGLLPFPLLFKRASPLSSLGNGPVAVRFQQLPGIVMDVDFLH